MSQIKLLIADADEVYRSKLRVYLEEKEDFEISEMGTGATVWNAAKTNQPSAVLLEIALPDINGIDVCKKIKSDDQLKFIPVIIHTANTKLEDRLNAFLMGANKYIEKPCKPEDIYACIKNVLRSYDILMDSLKPTKNL